MRTVIVTVNAAWNVVTFRSGLVRALIDAGYDVAVAAPRDEYVSKVTALGARFIPFEMDQSGSNVFRDLGVIFRYVLLLRREKPVAMLTFTIKPNIYGSIAARLMKIPVINNIAGLGTPFLRTEFLRTFVSWLYRAALSTSDTVFFQNDDDLSLFVGARIVHPSKTSRLPGSGIDPSHFALQELRSTSGRPFHFLFLGRILWDKGIGEYVEALRSLRLANLSVRGTIVGFLDRKNPSAVDSAVVRSWQAEGIIEYAGSCDDVRGTITASDCVVLPSYREGLPRVLLEAGAIGRPMIATDVPGCREVVLHGITGFLVPPKSSPALTEAMTRMLRLTDLERQRMGLAARKLIERNYHEKTVFTAYLTALTSIDARRKSTIAARASRSPTRANQSQL
jgi:glycosyltransferase involved in cell wall biosynthesis